MFLRCCWPPGWFLRICLVDTRSFWILILCLLTRFWLEPSITFVLAPMIVLSKYFNSVSYFIRLSTRYRFIIMSSGFIHGIVLVPFWTLFLWWQYNNYHFQICKLEVEKLSHNFYQPIGTLICICSFITTSQSIVSSFYYFFSVGCRLDPGPFSISCEFIVVFF